MKPLEDLESIFVVYSACTNMPYVYQHPEDAADLLLVFSKKELYDGKLEMFHQQNAPVRCVNVLKKQYDQFFTSMYYIGIDGILMDMGEDEKEYSLSELAKKPNYSAMPTRMMQLHNARLQLPMLYFLQEVRRPIPMEQKTGLGEMEEEVMINMGRTSFLIPYTTLQNGEQSQDPSKKQLQMLTIKDKEGDLFQPLFTDVMEFIKYSRQQKLECLIVPFWDLDKLIYQQVKGYIVNPLGCNMVIEHPQYEYIKHNFVPDTQGDSSKEESKQ